MHDSKMRHDHLVLVASSEHCTGEVYNDGVLQVSVLLNFKLGNAVCAR